MVLDVCVKSGVWRLIVASFCCKPDLFTIFRSGLTAPKGLPETVQKRVFRDFLEKLSLVFLVFYI